MPERFAALVPAIGDAFKKLDPRQLIKNPVLFVTAAIDQFGDIAIAYETVRKEADEEQKPFDHHLSHLAVHGYLHLIGYDHENDADAEAMESLETEILAQLGIPDPYADPDPYSERDSDKDPERMN